MFRIGRGGYPRYPLVMAGKATQHSGSRRFAGALFAAVALCLFALFFLVSSCSLASYANPSVSSDPLVSAASLNDAQSGANSSGSTGLGTSKSSNASSDASAAGSSESDSASSGQSSSISSASNGSADAGSDRSAAQSGQAQSSASQTDSNQADSQASASGSEEDSSATNNSADEAGAQSDDDALAAADSTSSSSVSDDYGTDTDPVSLNLRVAIGGEWKYVGKDGKVYDSASDEGFEPIVVTKEAKRAGGTREIIPASALVGPLAQFGFSTDELCRADEDYTDGSTDWGNFIFGYCDSGTDQMYADVSPQLVTNNDESAWYIFTKGRQWIHEDTGEKSLDLYYLPANRNDGAFTTPSSFFCETSRYTTDKQLIVDNGFYAVSVSDDGNRIYDEGETRPTAYLAASAGTAKASFTVKKPTKDTVKWSVVDEGGDAVEVSDVIENDDGTLTYTLAGIASHIIFKAIDYNPNKFDLVYTASLANSDRVTLGNIQAADQVIIDSENATIDDGKASLTVNLDATDGGDYSFLAPDTDIATVYWTQKTTRKFIYSFMGWQIAGQSKVYAAGDTISLAELKGLAAKTGSVSVKSVWSANDTNTSSPHIRSANFYLNLNCEILDVDGSSTSQGSDSYTESIYSTRVSGTDTFGSGGFTLLAPADASSAYDVDAQIRVATTNGGTGIKPPSSWTNYTQDGVTFERIPTDEEILAKARESSSIIKIDDEVIDKTDLTTANFTVRWSAVKYDETDGWHVDGVLVAKKARLVVSKTFEGETDALEQFKTEHGYSSLDDYDSSKGFSVDVTHEATVDGTTTDVVDYELLLLPESDVAQARTGTSDRRYGYTSYDAATNTYTWEIDARQNRLYTVKEENYYLNQDDWNNLTWYEVHNSNSTYNTNGWTEYNITTGANVKVLAAAYPTDVPSSAWQTIGFRNAYVHKGTLAVLKNDYTTGAAMTDVGFGVKQTDTGAESVLYQKSGTNEYTTDTAIVNEHPDAYTKVSQAKTDANGVFYLSLAAPEASADTSASYVLTENKEDVVGYDGPDTITFTMTYNEGIADGKVETEGGSSEVTWAKVGDNQFILNIYNRSVAYTSVTAKKEWAKGTVDKKPVTVQLWRSYGNVEEIVPEAGASGKSTLVDVDGNEASNEVQLSSDNKWTFSWGELPLFINNKPVTYFLREAWIGDPTSSDSVAYDASADPNDGYLDYAVTTEDARYTAATEMPDATVDDPRSSYAHDSSSWEAEDGGTTYAKHVLLMINNAEVKGIISLTKKDREGLAGKPLAGATFTLYSDSACTKEIESVTTGTNGVVSFTKQPAGTYYIKEVQAPAGYSFEASTVYKAVVSNGSPTITKEGDASQTAVTSVTNKFGAGLNVKKIGEGSLDEAAGVSGAEFTLAKVDGTGDWAQAHKLTTDASGGLSFTGLDQGTYTLTETKAPAGFEAAENLSLTFIVETGEDGKTTFALEDESKIDEDAASGFVKWDDNSSATNVAYTLTVRDVSLASLPSAGGLGIGPFVAGGFALMGAAALAWYLRERRFVRQVRERGRHA